MGDVDQIFPYTIRPTGDIKRPTLKETPDFYYNYFLNIYFIFTYIDLYFYMLLL